MGVPTAHNNQLLETNIFLDINIVLYSEDILIYYCIKVLYYLLHPSVGVCCIIQLYITI